jgi:hypothetical protein
LRHDVNVIAITGIEIDYDCGEVEFADALAALNELQVAALHYTSPSHAKGKPRWRVLCPTSGPLAPEMRARLVARLNGYLKARLGVDNIAKSESFALSQAFYYGWVCDSPKPDHRAEIIIGAYIDHLEDLQQYEALGAKPASSAGNTTGTGGTINWAIVERHLGWLKSVADLPSGFSAKGRAIIAHSGNLKDLNFDLDQANLRVKPYQSWSEVSLALAAIFKSDGRFNTEQIAAALLADLECNQHITGITDPAKQRRAVDRLILRSHAQPQSQKWRCPNMPNWRERTIDGSPVPSMHNARLAITALGIECSYDTFHTSFCLDTRTATRATRSSSSLTRSQTMESSRSGS